MALTSVISNPRERTRFLRFAVVGIMGAVVDFGTFNLLSSVVGAVVGITLIVAARHGRNIPIPFGPYLAGGGLIALFWGAQLTHAYLQLYQLP
jgi:prepilin signal peptidase PulO-like enzyme (type II secretory pathway)